MKNRLLIGAWLRVERMALLIARWARGKADAMLLVLAMCVLVGGLLAGSYVTSHALQVAGR